VFIKERCRKYILLFLTPSFFRFLIVGVSNFIIGYVLFVLMLFLFSDISFRAPVSQLISYSGGIVWSFLLNRKWTFKSDRYLKTHAIRFFILQSFLAVTSAVLLSLICDVMGYDPQIAWFGVMGIITIVNYILSKTWAFAEQHTFTSLF
jgi:putative flippase GtrA